MRRIITTTAIAFLTIASVATPAAAGTPEGRAVVVLGDSVAAGVGASNPEKTGYVPRFHRAMKSVDCRDGKPSACPHVELVSFAEGGATSAELITNQLGPAVAEIVARNGDADTSNDVEYIAITIGGNDVYEPVLGACSDAVDTTCVTTIQTVFANYQANLGQILGTLRAYAGDAEIAIITYYNPLGSCDLAAIAPVADLVLERGSGLPGGLNDIIRGVAAGVGGVTVVETYGLLGPKDLVGGEDCLHPDTSGHKKIARAFAQAVT